MSPALRRGILAIINRTFTDLGLSVDRTEAWVYRTEVLLKTFFGEACVNLLVRPGRRMGESVYWYTGVL
jgi:hypothetical protein